MTRVLLALVIGVGLSAAVGCGGEEEAPTPEEVGREIGESAREVQEEAEEFSESVREGYEQGEQEPSPQEEPEPAQPSEGQ